MTHGRSVLVTDVDAVTGLTVARSLHRAGWRVVTCHHRRRPSWLATRASSERHVVADPELDADGFAADLLDIAASRPLDLILPVGDKAILAIEPIRSQLPAPVALPSSGALSSARSKERTIELADHLGIPVPPSLTVGSEGEALQFAEREGWPVVVKPLTSHVRAGRGIVTRSVSVCSDVADLRRTLPAAGSGEWPLQVQAAVGTHGVGVELLMDRGSPVAAFQHRRLREVPLGGGMSSLRRAEIPDPELVSMAARLLAALDWHGVAMVEFRDGPDGPVLLEVNGRIWGSIALPVRAGVDFPRLLADLMVEGTTQSPEPVPGTECRNLELELRWLIAAVRDRRRQRRVAWSEIAAVAGGLLDPRNDFDVQVGWDPGPSVDDVVTSLVSIGREAAEQLVSARRTT